MAKEKDKETIIALAVHGFCGYCKELFVDMDPAIEVYAEGDWDFIATCPSCKRSYRGYR